MSSSSPVQWRLSRHQVSGVYESYKKKVAFDAKPYYNFTDKDKVKFRGQADARDARATEGNDK